MLKISSSVQPWLHLGYPPSRRPSPDLTRSLLVLSRSSARSLASVARSPSSLPAGLAPDPPPSATNASSATADSESRTGTPSGPDP